MKSQLLTRSEEPLKKYAVILETGDRFTACMLQFAREQALTGSQFSAIGAFNHVTLGYFDWQRKDYNRIQVDEQVEVVSLLGDVALDAKSQPALHAHVVVAKCDASAWGGHLLDAVVRPTLEIMITQSPATLVRRYDDETGLALIRP